MKICHDRLQYILHVKERFHTAIPYKWQQNEQKRKILWQEGFLLVFKHLLSTQLRFVNRYLIFVEYNFREFFRCFSRLPCFLLYCSLCKNTIPKIILANSRFELLSIQEKLHKMRWYFDFIAKSLSNQMKILQACLKSYINRTGNKQVTEIWYNTIYNEANELRKQYKFFRSF